MAAAVSKIMRVQDLVLVAQKIRVVTKFRGTLGLRGRLSTRLQPNHPTDEPAGIAASILDGLLYGNGDAMIGINPATDSIASICAMLEMLDAIIQRYDDPDPGLRADPRHHLDRGDQSRRAAGSGVSVDRRHRGGQRQFSASTWQCCRKATTPG